jgi:hypothetical protein
MKNPVRRIGVAAGALGVMLLPIAAAAPANASPTSCFLDNYWNLEVQGGCMGGSGYFKIWTICKYWPNKYVWKESPWIAPSIPSGWQNWCTGGSVYNYGMYKR